MPEPKFARVMRKTHGSIFNPKKLAGAELRAADVSQPCY